MERSVADELAERLGFLERENLRLARKVRWLTRGVAVAAASLLLAILAWPHLAGVPRSVHAEQFVLQDGEGKVRAILGIKPGLPRPGLVELALTRLGYRLPPMSVSGVFGPTLRVFDEAGKQRVALGLNREAGGVPFLTFTDAAELDRLAAYTMEDGGTSLHLRDGASNNRLSIATTGQGHGIISIQDAQGLYRFLAPPPPPDLGVRDDQGVYRPSSREPASKP